MKHAARLIILSLALSSVARAEESKETTGEKVSQKSVEFLNSASLIQYGFTFGIAGVVATQIKAASANQTDVALTAMPYVNVSFNTAYRALGGRRIVNKYCATRAIRLSSGEASAAADELAALEARAAISKEGYKNDEVAITAAAQKRRDAIRAIDKAQRVLTKALGVLTEKLESDRKQLAIARHSNITNIPPGPTRRTAVNAEWNSYKAKSEALAADYEKRKSEYEAKDKETRATLDARIATLELALLSKEGIEKITYWEINGPKGNCAWTWLGAFGGFPVGYSGNFRDHGSSEEKRDVTTRGAFGLSITPIPYFSVLFGLTRTATSRAITKDESKLDLGWAYVVGIGGNVDIFKELFK